MSVPIEFLDSAEHYEDVPDKYTTTGSQATIADPTDRAQGRVIPLDGDVFRKNFRISDDDHTVGFAFYLPTEADTATCHLRGRNTGNTTTGDAVDITFTPADETPDGSGVITTPGNIAVTFYGSGASSNISFDEDRLRAGFWYYAELGISIDFQVIVRLNGEELIASSGLTFGASGAKDRLKDFGFSGSGYIDDIYASPGIGGSPFVQFLGPLRVRVGYPSSDQGSGDAGWSGGYTAIDEVLASTSDSISPGDSTGGNVTADFGFTYPSSPSGALGVCPSVLASGNDFTDLTIADLDTAQAVAVVDSDGPIASTYHFYGGGIDPTGFDGADVWELDAAHFDSGTDSLSVAQFVVEYATAIGYTFPGTEAPDTMLVSLGFAWVF